MGCAASNTCIGVEYGVERSDKWGRCDCYLVNGQCSSGKGHLGFNVYLNDSADHTETMVLGLWAGADSANLLNSFNEMGADFFTSNLPQDVLAWMSATSLAFLV